jgi:hypothetical protein
MPSKSRLRTRRHGYVLDPAITPDEGLLTAIEAVVGISGEKANAAFHKSWKVVREASLESLVMQQIVHYLTTYGFENQGIYQQETVYVPHELLELPELASDIPLTVVRAMDADALLQAILNLGSGIALARETLADIMTIVEANAFDSGFAKQIGNRELKAMLYDHYGLVPDEPVEFLRHLVGKLTDESLLIKNDRLIGKIKEANGKFLDVLLKEAPPDLASIFYRYKPLFLAMKSISRNKTFFNRLRKQAPKLHQPVPEDFLNSVTSQLKHGVLDPERLSRSLAKASVFRKVRLAYALANRLHAGKSIVYRVRNGRGWATDFAWPKWLSKATAGALDLVLDSLVADIRPQVEGKTVYIPPYMYYALPATEKQFTGHLPTGTSVAAPEDLVVGVHWLNTDKRIDLDLSVIGQSGKFGWDSSYRSGDRRVLFSGDVTDAPAPRGATELFYLKGRVREPMILMLNFFNYCQGDEVEAKILVANERPRSFGNNYMVNPNNIVATANINVSRRQSVLGLVAPMHGANRVYFAHVSVGTSITAVQNAHSTHARNYLVDSLLDTIDFRDILARAGAAIVDEKTDPVDIDLSPEQLGRSTIIDLLR